MQHSDVFDAHSHALHSIRLYMMCITLHSDAFVMVVCIHLYLIKEWCLRPSRHSHRCMQCAFTFFYLSVFGFERIHDVFGFAWSRIPSNTFEAEYTLIEIGECMLYA